MKKIIRIVIADNHTMVLESIKNMLELQDDFEVIGEAKNGREAVDIVENLKPDVVVMDIGMPELNGIEATKRILAQKNNTEVVAVSMHEDKQFVTQMLNAGAKGYLVKEDAFEELATAIRVVDEGKSFLSPRITGIVIETIKGDGKRDDAYKIDSLTTREREVLQMLTEGLTSKEIASKLFLSAKTVENHRSQITGKLDIHSIAQLTKFAIKHGITFIE